ncbi:MAG: PAS domain S-box protein [Planctomycetota bacterium]
MASITLFVGAGHLSVYLRQRRERISLTFGLLCLTHGVYLLGAIGVYETGVAGETEWMVQWLRMVFVAIILAGIFFTWFASEYAGGRGRRAAFWITVAYFPPLLAALFHVRGLMWNGPPGMTTLDLPFGISIAQHIVPRGPILLYLIVPSMAACFFATMLGVRLQKAGERDRGRFLVAATLLYVAGGISDSLVLVGVYDFLYVYKYTFVGFIVLMTYSLASDLLSASLVRDALAKSEERLELAMEGSTDGLWDWSPADGEVHFSPRWYGMLGYEYREFPECYETWADLLHPGDRPKTESFVGNFIESGEEFFSIEFRMRARDGDWRWILARGKAVLRDERGHVSRMVGTHADITPMKDAEAALAESEHRFRSVVQSSPMGMMLYELRADDSLILVDSNRAADRFTGIDTRALVGRTIEDAFPALASTRVPAIYRKAARDGAPWEVQGFTYADDHVRGAFDLHAFQTSPGRMAVLFLDVTDRLRAEEALRRSEEMYRSYFRLGLIGMAITSAERAWLEINPRLAEMLGYPVDEIREMGWDDVSHPEDIEEDRRAYERLVRGEIEQYSMEKRFLAKRGDVVHTDLSVTCVRREDGHVEFAIAHLQDVTERKEAEEWLRQSQKMEAVGQLAGGVAHDFNNLLQAIQGYTDVALTQIADEHPASGNLAEVKRAAGRAATLTRQLLTFSRQEALQPAHLNLNDVIADLLKMLRRVIGEHVELVVSAQPGLRPIFADPGQVEQVILNLCINARDAMPSGGRLSLVTENARLAADFVRDHPWAAEGEYVVLRVADSGEGILPEIRDRIFEPFYTTKEVGQGTGLGLATVYAIAQRHEGGIEVESEPGEGAMFSFYLPVPAEAPADDVAPDEEAEPEGGTETILLAEDDAAVRSLVISLLEDVGYRLLVAENGAEAIRLFEEDPDSVDLVLVDVIMPKKGGREVYHAVRGLRPSIPVLFTTGYSFNALEKERIPGSTGQIIRKPYAPNDLLHRVREALDEVE